MSQRHKTGGKAARKNKAGRRKTVGAVLVAGGGPAGIQSALDLANSGFKVFLVEEGPSIGGSMAQLDKTFPTNDCSMCILSPKMADCRSHPNIELLTYSRIQEVEGSAGDFTVKVLRRARYVDETKCTGCGDCEPVCPVSVPSAFDMGMTSRKAVYMPYPQAVPGVVTIDCDGVAPCTNACPAGLSAQGYTALISQGKTMDAMDLILSKVPLPSVCGRICHRPCEDACNRKDVDSPVALAALKAFVGDNARGTDAGSSPETAERRDKKVAIVGAGPAGLTAAYRLARKGFGVRILEATDKPGGMLWWGIPDYRLPKTVLQDDVARILNAGVEIQYNTVVGRDITMDELRDEYDAVFVAIGAHKSLRLGVEGEDLNGVMHSIDFLRDVAKGETVALGGNVVVVGGGNAAMDAARTALRLGSRVTVLYRRTENEMPAIRSEIEAAKEEGVEMFFLAAPVRISGEAGTVKTIECVRMELGEPDDSGRRRPVPVRGSEFSIDADNVIIAVSQSPDIESLQPGDLRITNRSTVDANPGNLGTNLEGVFAGGDAVTGPASAIEAIAAGNRAAESIERYIDGISIDSEEVPARHVITIDDVRRRAKGKVPNKERIHRERVSVERRRTTFEEVERPFTSEQASEEASRCLGCGPCSLCNLCALACERKAIDYTMQDCTVDLNVGAIILAPGFSLFDAATKAEYGHGICRNVLTNLEFERMLSASGPTRGHVTRPSDGKEPRSIAFIQCVGSRDAQTPNTYCSSFCCMAALKQAVIAKEHSPGLDATIFFMDTRAFGKEFEHYLLRAENEHGVKVVRNNRVPKIEENAETNNLSLIYHSGPEIKEDEFDMVILSAGVRPTVSSVALAEATGIKLNRFGFCEVDELSPVESTIPGIFVCGTITGPKDIPDSIAQASGAAGKAAALLAEDRGRLAVVKEYPPERDVADQEPMIGVFVCHCGLNIGSVVNVAEVVDYASHLPNVVHAEENMYTCSVDTAQRIKDAIKTHGLNRLVVAACTPRTHEPLFQNICREAGLNKYLFEMANIRDQCSWVHRREPQKATAKAKDLVKMAVAKSAKLAPLAQAKIPVTPVALVIGGGLSGMSSALEIADAGYQVHLVEKTSQLGGHLRDIYHTLSGVDPQETFKRLDRRLMRHRNVTLHLDDEVTEVKGYVGNYETVLKSGKALKHGAIVVATGATHYSPTEHLYGKNPKVIRQTDLGFMLANDELDAENVVIIQCVGSRNEDHPSCSRICCSTAMANAVNIKTTRPETNVFVLYRDIRTYGLWEEHYNEAARLGVTFLRFDPEEPPTVTEEDDEVYVQVKEQFIEQLVRIRADYVVLNAAVHPNPCNTELSKMLKVPLTEEGFFLEAHMKLRPVDFATEGIYLCGLAHSPRLIGESISQSLAAAAKVNTVLSREFIEVDGIVSIVDEHKCSGCGLCVDVCPYGAVMKNEKDVAIVVAAACKGCGCCAATCPEAAISIANQSDDHILAMAKAFLEEL